MNAIYHIVSAINFVYVVKIIAIYYLKDVNVKIFVKIFMKKEIKVFAPVYERGESAIRKYAKIANIVVILKLLIKFLKKRE